MPSLKQLRRRIRTVASTKLITRAMRSVAASKMRKTQDRRTKVKPYVDRLQSLVAKVLSSASLDDQPLLQKRKSNKRLLVIFSSDRGLCGAFNASLIRYAEDFYKKSNAEVAGLYLIGKRAHSYFAKRGYPIAGYNTSFAGNIDVPEILKISRELQKLFLDGQYDSIELIYNHTVTAIVYRPKHEILLPLQSEELLASLGTEVKEEEKKEFWISEYIFEPDPQTLLSTLLPQFVETKILYTFIDAFAAEHLARMMAMTTANENCNELMDSLTLQLNKARQATITKELLEIVSGAEALKG